MESFIVLKEWERKNEKERENNSIKLTQIEREMWECKLRERRNDTNA